MGTQKHKHTQAGKVISCINGAARGRAHAQGFFFLNQQSFFDNKCQSVPLCLSFSLFVLLSSMPPPLRAAGRRPDGLSEAVLCPLPHAVCAVVYGVAGSTWAASAAAHAGSCRGLCGEHSCAPAACVTSRVGVHDPGKSACTPTYCAMCACVWGRRSRCCAPAMLMQPWWSPSGLHLLRMGASSGCWPAWWS